MNKTFDDIVILRIIATILVVISHCLYIYTYGPLSSLQVSDLIFSRWLVTDFIVKCNMPLFVFMSGFLLAYQYHAKQRFIKFSELAINKSKRLLLPYLVMSPLTIISLKESLQFNLLSLLCPIGHLWFLMMLFGCMIAGWVILSLKLDKPKVIIPILVILYLLAAAPPLKLQYNILAINDILKQLIYFYIGILCYVYEYKLRFLSRRMIWSAICFILIVVFQFTGSYFLAHEHYTRVQALIPIIGCLWVLVFHITTKFLLTSKKIKISPMWQSFGKCCFGIYLWHSVFINFVIFNKNMQELAVQHTILFPIILFIVIMPVSCLLTAFLQRYKFGRIIFG